MLMAENFSQEIVERRRVGVAMVVISEAMTADDHMTRMVVVVVKGTGRMFAHQNRAGVVSPCTMDEAHQSTGHTEVHLN